MSCPSRNGDYWTLFALMALVACPTGSIGTTKKHDARIGIDAFPSPIAENVYFCGFTSESSFGGWTNETLTVLSVSIVSVHRCPL